MIFQIDKIRVYVCVGAISHMTGHTHMKKSLEPYQWRPFFSVCRIGVPPVLYQ